MLDKKAIEILLDKARANVDKVVDDLVKADADWAKAADKANTDLDKANGNWNKAKADWDKANADWDKAADKANTDLDKARSDFDNAEAITEFLKQEKEKC